MTEQTEAASTLPRMLELNTSNVCNLRCATCVRNWETFKQPKPKYLTFEEFQVIIDRFPGLPKLQICGFSEPTLNKDVPAMIAYAKSKGVAFVEMFTNGTLLSGEFAQGLSTSGLDLLRVSIDGGDAETYRKVRGADLNTVVRNIRAFADQSDIPIRIETVLSSLTSGSIELMPEVAHQAGANYLSIRLIDGQDEQARTHAISIDKDMYELRKRLQTKCKDYGIELIMVLPEEEEYADHCTAWEEIYIDESGAVFPCYLTEGCVGNILQTPYKTIQATHLPTPQTEGSYKKGQHKGCKCHWALQNQD